MVWFYTEALNAFSQVSYQLTVVSYFWDSCSLPQTGVQPCLQAFPWQCPSCQTEWLQQRTDQILWCTVCGELLSPFHDFRTSHTSSGSSLHKCFHLSHQWKVHSSILPASSCQARLGAIEWMFVWVPQNSCVETLGSNHQPSSLWTEVISCSGYMIAVGQLKLCFLLSLLLGLC